MKTRAAAPIVAAVLLPLIALTLFSPFYQTNDDVTMRLLAEGHFVPEGAPVPFLLFINIVIGWMLATAYTLLPGVPWYDLLLGASLIAAAAALVVVWIGSGRRRDVLWAVILAVYFLLPAFVSVQFTIAGLTCSAAGIALLVSAAAEPRTRRSHAIFGTALFVWGSLIRFQGAALMAIEGAALSLPLLLVALRGPEARARRRALLLSASMAAVLMMTFFAADRIAYKRARGWEDFHEFNALRARMSDFITSEQVTPPALARLRAETGWSENDFVLFVGWFFTDPTVYSLANVRKAAAVFDDEVRFPLRLRSAWQDAGAFLLNMRWAFVIMGAFVLGRAGPRLIVFFLGTTLTIVVLFGVVSFLLKAPPQRVYWPMLILGATMLTIAARREEPSPRAWQTLAAIAVAILVTGRSLQTLHSISNARKRAAGDARRDVVGLRQTGARLIIIQGNAFPFESYWQPLHTPAAPFPFVSLGVTNQTPPVQAALRRYASTDVAWSLCSDPALILITWDAVTPLLAQSVLDHHGAAVRFEPVFRSELASGWRCRR